MVSGDPPAAGGREAARQRAGGLGGFVTPRDSSQNMEGIDPVLEHESGDAAQLQPACERGAFVIDGECHERAARREFSPPVPAISTIVRRMIPPGPKLRLSIHSRGR